MTACIALLRGINVGGTGLLPMADLKSICLNLGFGNPRTYIQSGNVVFHSLLNEQAIRQALESALLTHMGKAVDVMVRTGAELRAVLQANPFSQVAGNKVYVHFLHTRPLTPFGNTATPGGEELAAGIREMYVYYPEGMGQSKLKLPLGNVSATARNMNTVAKLVALADA